jgi:3-deoxy-manno-octulosonate cytidylyltransferase (CMP-KDO synthetase)
MSVLCLPMNKAVAIIPARWGSSRFPGKPLHLIGGKALLQHVWERCRRARAVESVIIATDDMRIANAAFDWGAEVALTSRSHASGTDRIAEVARKAKQFAYVVNVQGDEPLIEPSLIDKLVRKLDSDPEVGIITAAHPFASAAEAASPHQVKVLVDLKGRALYFSRALIPYSRSSDLQSAEQSNRQFVRHGTNSTEWRRNRRPLFLRHQGVYAFRRQTLLQFVRWKRSPLERTESLEQLRALENGVTVHVLVTNHGSPGVDTLEEAKALEQKLARAKRRSVSR